MNVIIRSYPALAYKQNIILRNENCYNETSKFDQLQRIKPKIHNLDKNILLLL